MLQSPVSRDPGRAWLWSLRAAAAGLLALLATGCGGPGARLPASGQSARVDLLRCEDLRGLAIAAGDIGLPTRGAIVRSVEREPELVPYADPDGEHLLPTAARCVVQGAIASVDPAAPAIQFALNLPLRWNGRALQSGGGGLGGSVITAPRNKGSGRFDPVPLDRPYPVTLGYATFGSDGGHATPDIGFMRHDEAMRNWAGDELKKTRDVALKIIAAAYGRSPSHVFFSGESAGGREAMMAAQKFPDDYDGIIATSPVLSWNYIHLADNALRDRLIQGWLDEPAIRLLADRTRASCDRADGLADGVIARYLECPNDVAALRCAGGKAAAGCLTDAQIASVNAIREPWSMAVPGTPMIAEYFRAVRARLGDELTERTVRLYVGAGGGHNVTGPSQVDTLSLLEGWVLEGRAPPDAVPAFDIDPTNLKTLRTMLACRYPSYARYKGSGPIDRADSFGCAARADPLEFSARPADASR